MLGRRPKAGRLPITIDTVINAAGNTEARAYAGEGAIVSVDALPLAADFEVRNAAFVLSLLHGDVRTLWGEYRMKRAICEIYRAPFSPTSRLPISLPRRRFRGRIDKASQQMPQPGQEGGISISAISSAAELRIINPAKRSDQTQQRRNGDRHSKYADVVGQWDRPWGSN